MEIASTICAEMIGSLGLYLLGLAVARACDNGERFHLSSFLLGAALAVWAQCWLSIITIGAMK